MKLLAPVSTTAGGVVYDSVMCYSLLKRKKELGLSCLCALRGWHAWLSFWLQ